jgi:hypothetical protein
VEVVEQKSPADFKWRYDAEGWSLDESQIPWRARSGRLL